MRRNFIFARVLTATTSNFKAMWYLCMFGGGFPIFGGYERCEVN